MVRAQVAPAARAIRFPRAGSGAVNALAAMVSEPISRRIAPAATVEITAKSALRIGSRSTNGPSKSRYNGAVDCRKIALAEVVDLVASTNKIIVAA